MALLLDHLHRRSYSQRGHPNRLPDPAHHSQGVCNLHSDHHSAQVHVRLPHAFTEGSLLSLSLPSLPLTAFFPSHCLLSLSLPSLCCPHVGLKRCSTVTVSWSCPTEGWRNLTARPSSWVIQALSSPLSTTNMQESRLRGTHICVLRTYLYIYSTIVHVQLILI